MQKPAKTEREAMRRKAVAEEITRQLVKSAKVAFKNKIDYANFIRGCLIAYEEASK